MFVILLLCYSFDPERQCVRCYNLIACEAVRLDTGGIPLVTTASSATSSPATTVSINGRVQCATEVIATLCLNAGHLLQGKANFSDDPNNLVMVVECGWIMIYIVSSNRDKYL